MDFIIENFVLAAIFTFLLLETGLLEFCLKCIYWVIKLVKKLSGNDAEIPRSQGAIANGFGFRNLQGYSGKKSEVDIDDKKKR